MFVQRYHYTSSSYNPEELVRVRRALITGGRHVSCPRCRSGVTVGTRHIAADRQTCRVHCRSCGCRVTMHNVPESALPL